MKSWAYFLVLMPSKLNTAKLVISYPLDVSYGGTHFVYLLTVSAKTKPKFCTS